MQFLAGEDPLEEEMATHSSILTGKILWTEEPGNLQSMGLQKVGPLLRRTQGPDPSSKVEIKEGALQDNGQGGKEGLVWCPCLLGHLCAKLCLWHH